MTCSGYLQKVEECTIFDGKNCLWPCTLQGCVEKLIEGWTYCLLYNCSSIPPTPQPPSSKDTEIGIIVSSVCGGLVSAGIGAYCAWKKFRSRQEDTVNEQESNQENNGSSLDPYFSIFDDSEDDTPIIRNPTSLANQNYHILSDSEEDEINICPS